MPSASCSQYKFAIAHALGILPGIVLGILLAVQVCYVCGILLAAQVCHALGILLVVMAYAVGIVLALQVCHALVSILPPPDSCSTDGNRQ